MVVVIWRPPWRHGSRTERCPCSAAGKRGRVPAKKSPAHALHPSADGAKAAQQWRAPDESTVVADFQRHIAAVPRRAGDLDAGVGDGLHARADQVWPCAFARQHIAAEGVHGIIHQILRLTSYGVVLSSQAGALHRAQRLPCAIHQLGLFVPFPRGSVPHPGGGHARGIDANELISIALRTHR